MRRVTAAGKAFIEANEGRRYKSYQDDAGVWTNGIGHTGSDVFPGQVVDDQQVESWFDKDLSPVEEYVDKNAPADLAPEEFDAICDLGFNIGVPELSRSTLMRLVKARRYDLVHDQFLVWNKVTINGEKVVDQGLVNRRMKEAAMWEHGMVPVELATLPVSNVVPDAAPEQRPTYRSSRTLWAQGVAFFGVIWSFISQSVGDIGDAFQHAADGVSGLLQYSDKLKFVFLTLSAVAIMLTFAERIRKLRIGK